MEKVSKLPDILEKVEKMAVAIGKMSDVVKLNH
jgi:hypothetical protein